MSSWTSISLRHQLNKRIRYVGNRLGRLSPNVKRRAFILTCVGAFFVLCVGLAHAASKSLELEDSDLVKHRKLAEALRRHAHNGTVKVTRPDVFVYPPFPSRPPVFPNPDTDHLHGQIGYDFLKHRPDWSPERLTFKMSLEDKKKAHEGYCFNSRVSASLALDRKIPDFNKSKCLREKYEDLPKADVIIVFHNEDLSVLLRSVHSILNRTPPDLLNEVILVNDDSNKTTHGWLFDRLPGVVEHLPKTELIHLTKRRGLMMARMEGTYRSTADVVVYLDSHIECANRWLEPMLKQIKDHPKRIVTPMIHSIDADNFEFESNAVGVVSFSWTLGQTHPHTKSDDYTPLTSPVMAGGLFATNREWFLDLGGYDPEMKLYGGEEMEIGFKVWQCGGELYNLPCSRVGHVFRTDKFWKGQVYKVPTPEIIRNKLRTVEVWLDEYKPIAKLAMSKLDPGYTLGPLDEVLAIRERHKCKPFKWFVETICPDVWVPNLDHYRTGSLMNPATRACIDTMGRNLGRVGLYPCHGQHGTQAIIHGDEQGDIRTAGSAFKNCLEVQKDDIHMAPCDDNRRGGFKFDILPEIEHVQVFGDTNTTVVGLMRIERRCMSGSRDSKGELQVKMAPCESSDPQQHWGWGT